MGFADFRSTFSRFLGAGLVLSLGALAAPSQAADPSGKAAPKLAFHVGKVVVMDDADRVINDAIVLVRDGKVEQVGPASQVTIPEDYAQREFPDGWLVPGLIEGHDHVAGSLSDLNDMVYQTNPGLDTRSTIQPNNDLVKMARMGGITTMMLIPGSGTNISGFGTVAKSGGDTPDEVIIRTPGSLKIAQAGNPEWYFGGTNRSFMNWNTRTTLEKALAYHQAWDAFEKGESEQKPEFDPIWDGFRGLFRREYPATVHTQIYQVLMTTVEMVTKKLRIWTVLDHCTFDAWKVAATVLESDAWALNGPRQFHFDRTAARMIGNASGWWKNGMHRLGINTDAPVIPQEELSYQAAMACWYGWAPYPALKGVTSVPAKALGFYDRFGSVEAGKDADLSIWTGDPLDPRSACLMTLVNGRVVYDGTKGVRRF